MAEEERTKKFYEQGGGGIFVSLTTSTTREVYSSEHHSCVKMKDLAEAAKYLSSVTDDIRFRAHFVYVEIFTNPRLCEECMKHASTPEVIEDAKHVTECLCWIEKSPCGVHKIREGK